MVDGNIQQKKKKDREKVNTTRPFDCVGKKAPMDFFYEMAGQENQSLSRSTLIQLDPRPRCVPRYAVIVQLWYDMSSTALKKLISADSLSSILRQQQELNKKPELNKSSARWPQKYSNSFKFQCDK